MRLAGAAGCYALAVATVIGPPGGGNGNAEAPTRGVWIWGQTVRSEGAEKVAARLAEARINAAFLLVKGLAGRASFNSGSALKREAGADVLREMLDACRPRGIRVHAWLMFHGDAEWVKARPGDAMRSCGGGKDDGDSARRNAERVCPASPEYRAYLQGLIREIVSEYPVDGIHLDGIRYPALTLCFCARHREKARRAGIDFEKVRQAAVKAAHEPGARDHFIRLYRGGDPDVRRWVEMRREEIDSFVRETREVMRAARPEARLSAALMPEGAAEEDAFALCHYAQDYRSAGAACDFICSMSYHASYGKPAAWPADVAVRAAARAGRPALAGLQAFDGVTAAGLGEALRETERRGLPGFVLFRYGTLTRERWAPVRVSGVSDAR